MQIFGITENSSSVRKGWINGHGVKVETWFIVVLACVRLKKKKKKMSSDSSFYRLRKSVNT